jgi:hypothetical protein
MSQDPAAAACNASSAGARSRSVAISTVSVEMDFSSAVRRGRSVGWKRQALTYCLANPQGTGVNYCMSNQGGKGTHCIRNPKMQGLNYCQPAENVKGAGRPSLLEITDHVLIKP